MRVTRRITGLLMPLLLTMWTIGATAKKSSLKNKIRGKHYETEKDLSET